MDGWEHVVSDDTLLLSEAPWSMLATAPRQSEDLTRRHNASADPVLVLDTKIDDPHGQMAALAQATEYSTVGCVPESLK